MLIARRYRLFQNGRWLTIPALAAAVMGGAHFFASAEDQVAARRPRRVMVPSPYAPQYCPPPAPVCPPAHLNPPTTAPAPQPSTPQPTTPSTTPPGAPAPSTTTPPSTTPSDPNDPRNLPPAQQDQTQTPQNNFQPQADQSLASAADAQSAAPNIIGDFFGATGGSFFFTQNIAPLSLVPSGNGSVGSQFTDGLGNRYGLKDGSSFDIRTDQTVGSAQTPLVLLDQLGQPVPGSPIFFADVRGGTVTLQQQQTAVGSAPTINTGIVRLAESTSPIPRDRIFFNYSYFNNAPLAQGNVSLSRYTFGVEKTFFDGMTSVELRAPFATTLSSNRFFDGSSDLSNRNDVEMADLLLTGKLLLWQNEQFALSTGASFQGPTGDDTNIFVRDLSTQQFIRVAQIDHSAFHVLPFVGAVWTPNESLFAQSLLQIDQPFNGDTVRTRAGGATGDQLIDIGRLNQQTFAYWTSSVGYWLYRENTTDDWGMSGFAPIAELHYNSSLSDEDLVTSPNGAFNFGGAGGKTEVVNATIGAVTQFGWNKSLYIGYATPLGGGLDRQFNGELRAIFNWRFGAQQFRNVPVFQ
jgi:hypothetical protein